MSLVSRVFALVLLTAPALCMSPAAAPTAILDVAQVNSQLKRAETNLDLVNGSIGHLTSPPKGSAARLAETRLASAKGDLDVAKGLLEGLSGDGVAEATARYDTDFALYEKLNKILTGEPPAPAPTPEPAPTPTPTPTPAPTPTPTPTPAPAPAPAPEAPKTVKLGYPHADNFKNALFTLRRVETDTAGLVNLMEQLRSTEDQLSINHRTTTTAMEKLTETRRQAGFAAEALAKIPANGEGVAEAKQRLADTNGRIELVGEYVQPLHARLMDMIDPAKYPELAADVKRLRELTLGYKNPELLFRELRTQAAEAYSQMQPARAECVRIAQAYLRLMEQGTEQGKQVEGAGNSFLGAQDEFAAYAEQQKTELPADIRKDLAEADRYANEAVAEQQPLWFTGGIPQRMEWARDKLALYLVIDPAGGAALAKEVDAMAASLAKRADSLRELIIRENTAPNDVYAGADREAVIAIALSAWKIQEPDFELLAVRIPAESWSRETKMTYSNGSWYFVDVSSLQVRLLVADKTNPELAIDRPINVRMDHQKGDAMIGVPMRSFDELLQPSEYMLRSKVPAAK